MPEKCNALGRFAYSGLLTIDNVFPVFRWAEPLSVVLDDDLGKVNQKWTVFF